MLESVLHALFELDKRKGDSDEKNKLVIIVGILFLLLGSIFGGTLYLLEWDKAMLWEHGKIDYLTQYANIYNCIRDSEAVLMICGFVILLLLFIVAIIGLLRYKQNKLIFIVTIVGVLLAPLVMVGYYMIMWAIPLFIVGCIVFALFCFFFRKV
ncbi:hypothetical protein [Culicoidibacter larvae]|uniref:Uncharacterized protein n=1 Tax=Culicoidibacter larvae TaxID=2579976 RepID=A0A5R8QHR9_9FIRM|nr:hypothetical protein [Culicoidibacter larvae]TLG77230.1 hypothetical protein FEZ08_01035 [Culicoidibacter larvae]